ncbi:hypothetical protein AFLA_010344 [Aspergillus flavus NRRL3357]|nr:hypothetical protein AFLA_010344 [Aspergillus flavus NRRL3357]
MTLYQKKVRTDSLLDAVNIRPCLTYHTSSFKGRAIRQMVLVLSWGRKYKLLNLKWEARTQDISCLSVRVQSQGHEQLIPFHACHDIRFV